LLLRYRSTHTATQQQKCPLCRRWI
jgi:hypothetical protein